MKTIKKISELLNLINFKNIHNFNGLLIVSTIDSPWYYSNNKINSYCLRAMSYKNDLVFIS